MLSPVEKCIVRISASLGIIEGLVWGILSVIGICKYFSNDEINYEPKHFIDYYNEMLYQAFLIKSEENNLGSIFHAALTSRVFVSFLFIFLFLGALWIAVSACIYYVSDKASNRGGHIYLGWTIITVVVSCFDFILVCLIGDIFGKCMRHTEDQESYITLGAETTCHMAFIPMLVIAFRGFILWFINVIFAYMCYKIYKRLKGETHEPNIQTAGTVPNQYVGMPIPRLREHTPKSFPNQNFENQPPPFMMPRNIPNRSQVDQFPNRQPYAPHQPQQNFPSRYPSQGRDVQY